MSNNDTMENELQIVAWHGSRIDGNGLNFNDKFRMYPSIKKESSLRGAILYGTNKERSSIRYNRQEFIYSNRFVVAM